MNELKIKTKSGKEIKLSIETKEESLIDHNFKIDCYNLVVEIEGMGKMNSPQLVDDKQYGLVIRETYFSSARKIVQVTEKTNEVKTFFKNYTDEYSRRFNNSIKKDIEYNKNYNKIIDAMTMNGCSY